MDTRGGYAIHRIFICALFLLGNVIIFIPKNISFGDLLVAFLVGFFLAFLFNFIFKKAPLKKYPKLAAVISLPFLSYFFLATCRDYVVFTDSTKMPNTSAAIIAVLFAVLSILGGICKKESLFRLSIVLFIVSVIILLFLTLFSLPMIKITGLDLNLNKDGILDLLIGLVLPAISVVYFIKSGYKRNSTLFFGFVLGGVILVVCFLLCAFTLGSAISQIRYPLATVGGVISMGKGYLRFEGFIYLLTMLTCFIKSSVIFFLIKKASLILNRRFYKIMLAVLPFFAALISVANI